MKPPSRRQFLLGAATVVVTAARPLAASGPSVAEIAQGRLGPAEPFSFPRLIERARRMAAAPYAPPPAPEDAVLDALDPDARRRIDYRRSAEIPLRRGEAPAQFLPMSRQARLPVRMNLLQHGEAREILYSQDAFDAPPDSPLRALGDEAGFAGLRIMRPEGGPDWISFLGASYFRCDGPEGRYGLSARGVAVDTGLDRPEEFPAFVEFWIGEGEAEDEDVVFHALLDGPSVAGALRIAATREAHFPDGDLAPRTGQRLKVESRLFLRRDVERLGIAPLTSMHWHSEADPAGAAEDWRPEAHGSDGLAMETGAGERLWRPLRNPHRVTTTSFMDRAPRGFGLIQRDRDFDHYQDEALRFEKRPSAWVTPLGDWGEGAVQLVEIPTADDAFDNIVVYWRPATPTRAGDALAFDYFLDWRARDPAPIPADGGRELARAVASRMGRAKDGDAVAPGLLRYVVDFQGPALSALTGEAAQQVDLALEARGGEIRNPSLRRMEDGRTWRLRFDLAGADRAPADLRAHLRRGDRALSETWTQLADRVGAPGL